MAVAERRIEARPEDVFAVLADGWSYAAWVVGASRIRDVDPRWPARGSVIHHSVGAWPLLLDDNTEVIEVEPARRLVLQARGWPVGEARIAFTLTAQDSATLVRMDEGPSHGPAGTLLRPLLELVLPARNRETLLRLAKLAEGREQNAVRPIERSI